jgi:hypothetical protein
VHTAPNQIERKRDEGAKCHPISFSELLRNNSSIQVGEVASVQNKLLKTRKTQGHYLHVGNKCNSWSTQRNWHEQQRNGHSTNRLERYNFFCAYELHHVCPSVCPRVSVARTGRIFVKFDTWDFYNLSRNSKFG